MPSSLVSRIRTVVVLSAGPFLILRPHGPGRRRRRRYAFCDLHLRSKKPPRAAEETIMFRATTRLGVTLALACGLVVGTSGVSEAAPRMSLRRGGLPAVRTPALRFRGSMIAPALRQRFPSPG